MAGQGEEGFQGFLVGNADIFGAARILEHGVFRAYRGVVQSCGYGIHRSGIACGILDHIGIKAVQYARFAKAERGRVLAVVRAVSAGFHADKAHAGVIHKAGKNADGV